MRVIFIHYLRKSLDKEQGPFCDVSRMPYWLIELWLYVSLDTKTDHFGDVPQANLMAWYGKNKPNTTEARIQQSKKVLQHKINTKKI